MQHNLSNPIYKEPTLTHVFHTLITDSLQTNELRGSWRWLVFKLDMSLFPKPPADLCSPQHGHTEEPFCYQTSVTQTFPPSCTCWFAGGLLSVVSVRRFGCLVAGNWIKASSTRQVEIGLAAMLWSYLVLQQSSSLASRCGRVRQEMLSCTPAG